MTIDNQEVPSEQRTNTVVRAFKRSRPDDLEITSDLEDEELINEENTSGVGNLISPPAPRVNLFPNDEQDAAEDDGAAREEKLGYEPSSNEEECDSELLEMANKRYVFDYDAYMGPKSERIERRSKAFWSVRSMKRPYVDRVLNDMERVIVISPIQFSSTGYALTPGSFVFIEQYSKRKWCACILHTELLNEMMFCCSAHIYGMPVSQVREEIAFGCLLLACGCCYRPRRRWILRFSDLQDRELLSNRGNLADQLGTNVYGRPCLRYYGNCSYCFGSSAAHIFDVYADSSRHEVETPGRS
jgi:hypothetical protein